MDWNAVQRASLDTFLRRYAGVMSAGALATAAGELAVTLAVPQGIEDELPVRIAVARAVTMPAEAVNNAYTLVRNPPGSGVVVSGYWEVDVADVSISTIVGAFYLNPSTGLPLTTIPVPGGLQARDSRSNPQTFGSVGFGAGVSPTPLAAFHIGRAASPSAASVGALRAYRSPEMVAGPGADIGIRINGPNTPNALVSFVGYIRALNDQELR